MKYCKGCNSKLSHNNVTGYCKTCLTKMTPRERMLLKFPNDVFCKICGKQVSNANKKEMCVSCVEKQNNSYEKGNKKRKATNLKKYGFEFHQSSQSTKDNIFKSKLENHGSGTYNNQEQHKQTCIEKFGHDHHWQDPEIIQKRIKTYSKVMKSKPPEFWRNASIKRSITKSKLSPVDGIHCDSTWEQNFIKTHPGCKRGPVIELTDQDNKIRHWNIDFEWNGFLYEVKNPWMFSDNCTWGKHSQIDKSKFLISKDIDIRWYLWDPGNWNWPKLNPIEEFRARECHVGLLKNPWEAFNDQLLKFKAEENLARYITWPGMIEKFLNKGPDKMLYERFTIAKIAPKVTVGSVSEAKRSIKYAESIWGKLNGIMNPCAGFGNWSKAAQELGYKTKGFDINPFLIENFGWEYQDVLTMNPIGTQFTVWCSPPVFNKETWGQDIKLQSKEDWYNLIRSKIKAPHYIFVNGTDSPTGGLFGNKRRHVEYV